jgi:hypothetical protein
MTCRFYATVWLVSLLSLVPLQTGCSVDRLPVDEVDSPSPTDGPRPGDMSIPPPVCKGRFCDVPKCPPGTTTEVVGKLYAGNGKDPIPGRCGVCARRQPPRVSAWPWLRPVQ